jgi:hypothetical protein
MAVSSWLNILIYWAQMFRHLLIAALFVQVPAQTGTVSGVLKDRDGKPVEGIRMAAVPRPAPGTEEPLSSAMSSIAETDSAGRYTLENIPPGRYYVAAGRVDGQTYFPGTADVTAAREILIAPGQRVLGIDFALNASSFGRAFAMGGAAIPLSVKLEGGGPLPLSGAGKATVVRVISPDGTRAFPTSLAGTFVMSTGTEAGAHRVTVENLPVKYVVKSITFGSTDLLTNPLLMALADPTAVAGNLQPLLPVPAAADVVARNSQRPISPIAITLAQATPPRTTGVHVSGRLDGQAMERQTVYLSDIPGDLYLDGTFEFYGVPPGRHSIVTRNNPRDATPFSASVVVRDRDLDNIVLSEAFLVPMASWQSAPRPIGSRAQGNVPLARISGTVVEESSRKAVPEGEILVRSGNHYYTSTFYLDADGRFEIPSLLPGIYELEVKVFGHSAVKRSVEIDDEDVTVAFAPRKLR